MYNITRNYEWLHFKRKSHMNKNLCAEKLIKGVDVCSIELNSDKLDCVEL